MHANLLADRVDVSARDLVRASDEVFEVDVIRQIHLCCDRREDETLLATAVHFLLPTFIIYVFHNVV